MLHEELKRRFPFLGTDEDANGADVVDALSEWYAEVSGELPEANIVFGALVCPHCGEANLEYIASVGYDAKTEFISLYDYSAGGDGDNDRLSCRSCVRESQLPKGVDVDWT